MGSKRTHKKRVKEWMDVAKRFVDMEKDKKGSGLEKEFEKLAKAKKELEVLEGRWENAIREGKSNTVVEKMMLMAAEMSEKIDEEKQELEEKTRVQSEQESILDKYCDMPQMEKVKYMLLFLEDGGKFWQNGNVDDYPLLGSDSYLDKVALGAVLLDGKQQLVRKAGKVLKDCAEKSNMSQKKFAEMFTVDKYCERLAEYYKRTSNFEFKSVVESVTLYWSDVDKIGSAKEEYVAGWFRKPNQTKVITRVEYSLR